VEDNVLSTLGELECAERKGIHVSCRMHTMIRTKLKKYRKRRISWWMSGERVAIERGCFPTYIYGAYPDTAGGYDELTGPLERYGFEADGFVFLEVRCKYSCAGSCMIRTHGIGNLAFDQHEIR